METMTLRTDERLSAMAWPNLQPIDVPIVSENDCFVVCAGLRAGL